MSEIAPFSGLHSLSARRWRAVHRVQGRLPIEHGDDVLGRAFGHLAYQVDDIYALCAKLQAVGVTINRPPRDGVMAFVRSPDHHSIELLQKGEAKPPQEPWKSMPNTGKW